LIKSASFLLEANLILNQRLVTCKFTLLLIVSGILISVYELWNNCLCIQFFYYIPIDVHACCAIQFHQILKIKFSCL